MCVLQGETLHSHQYVSRATYLIDLSSHRLVIDQKKRKKTQGRLVGNSVNSAQEGVNVGGSSEVQ